VVLQGTAGFKARECKCRMDFGTGFEGAVQYMRMA
jgi:hypothetical protein